MSLIDSMIPKSNSFNGLVFEFDASTGERIPLAGGISEDDNAPTFATGLAFDSVLGDFELVTTGPWANTGAVLNNTGFDVDAVGTFDVYLKNNGTVSRLDIWSESSSDGVVITVNTNSARSLEVSNSSESSQTKSSKIQNWKHGDMVRFCFTDTGGGDCNLEQANISGRGQTVTSPSFAWRLTVTKKTLSE